MLKFNFKCLFITVINKALFKTMRKLNTLLFTSLLSLNYLHAQIEYNFNDSINFFDKLKKNNSRIYQSPKIEKISSIYFKQTAKKISVFKIQLNTLNNSRKTAKSDSIKFENIFYPEKIEIAYEAPYFKSKTKYYLQKKEAERKLQEIAKYFKNAFILQEEVGIEEFK